MSDEDRACLRAEARPVHETLQHRGDRVGVRDHRRRNPRERRDEWRNGARGLYERRKLVNDGTVLNTHCTDLSDFRASSEPRRFQVDNHPASARGRGPNRIQAGL